MQGFVKNGMLAESDYCLHNNLKFENSICSALRKHPQKC